ncbi:putative deoxyribodipyrimidine photo-lyase [Rosa chinensis]|uniref:Deoxyribodipyrimidine photo-lyase n=1 Tax=Rosa chinensis TaxID=74649 RepID=A0A2P6P7Z9_ROSCH|nr:deoxyribodipyrimidine photo-lyase [Rosa chinensis]XP_024173054.1 deoxyribodipyrimidine photo-lyase [Rosa chinensis]XP_024173055.1 deoxyribodipyrimidine photo-lyase [Rosa chinensis]XP_024173056.1 deoxyribodipyrimidine photo-lyase [Rosa chinensis]XP_024173058.1 deoxyribodipyrimidine photo-lyase [Rosa chinensis]XP_040367175.1 deoxyribodipyrimidine photo-lyase [Rosa chinensis]XP_040367176.1 deoxyribodipyrimidine photo-lyase [Rosa chinensis]XP_040367177.1 deoxyribodipyrimidine photo-lyase [Ros
MAANTASVQPGRFRVLKQGAKPVDPNPGPVVYWMFRDQRVKDNWALIHAVEEANKAHVPVAVAFNLFDQFLGAKARHLGFMLRGLRQLHPDLQEAHQIPFFLVRGEAEETIPNFMRECGASLLVTDFSPLREVQKCKEEIRKRVSDFVTIHEVDAHNVVPVWAASEKLEYSARTIRSKINKRLPEYLIEFPTLQPPIAKWVGTSPAIDWDGLIDEVLRKGAEVPEVDWCEPGEKAAMEVLKGSKNGFLTKRLKGYSSDRNNPLKPRGVSGLSPYLHFGQISAQRCALEARSVRKLSPLAVDAFLEELIVRRELADNYCFYQPQYDSLQGAWEWARKTLMDHASDKREHIYTREQLEKAQTADPLWNASQCEMVHYGKMHGFLRMYWAKKILEWTRGPEEALEISIYLNNKYEMDGRDPNGYVGCMWSICGVHDQGWKERPIFGKIRYMNYAGCKRKFDVDGYVAYVQRLGATKKRKLLLSE